MQLGNGGLVQLAFDLGGGAEGQRPVRYLHVLRYQRPRTDQAVAADLRAVQHDGAHADEGVVTHGAPMEDGPVAHRYVFAHRHRMVVVHVHHTVVLDICSRTDGDRRPVAPQHRAEEHAAVGAQGHAAPDGGVVRHKGGGMDDSFFHGCTSQKFFCIVSQLSGKIDSHGKICAYIFRQNMLY